MWSLTGPSAIENRTEQLVRGATDELVFVVGDDTLLSEDLVAELNDVPEDVSLYVGAPSDALRAEIQERVPRAQAFVSGLEWLRGDEDPNELAVGRLLLADRSTILVSTILPDTGEEHAVFGHGFGNGLVVVVRRLMSQGLDGVDARSE